MESGIVRAKYERVQERPLMPREGLDRTGNFIGFSPSRKAEVITQKQEGEEAQRPRVGHVALKSKEERGGCVRSTRKRATKRSSPQGRAGRSRLGWRGRKEQKVSLPKGIGCALK